MISRIIIALYVIASSAALVVLKLGTKSGAPISLAENKIHLNLTPYALIGIFLYGTSFLLYMYLISKFDLGYIIPLTTALIYIIIFSASFIIFKESFTTFKIIGIVLIVLGLVFLNIKK
jgi:drug/metabolite transporter (DMT)-like permease